MIPSSSASWIEICERASIAIPPIGWSTSRPPSFIAPTSWAKEIQAAGLTLQGVYGIEGPGWILPDIAERMADAQRREALLRVARMLETESTVVGTSSHLLAVARRPR